MSCFIYLLSLKILSRLSIFGAKWCKSSIIELATINKKETCTYQLNEILFKYMHIKIAI